MLKIITNHNKIDIVYSYTLGGNFPDIQGKLLRVELSGKELEKYTEFKEIPLYEEHNTLYLVWSGKHAGHVLKILREIL